jgi:hypothetical protein
MDRTLATDMQTNPQQVSTSDFLFVTDLQEMVVCNILSRIALEQSHNRKENPEPNTPEKKNKNNCIGRAPQSFTTGQLFKSHECLVKSKTLCNSRLRRKNTAMHEHRLCAPRKSAVILSSPTSFLKVCINLDAIMCGGRPASLKHFGFNVSPPHES